ncbi:MAG: universal stress protein [Thiohalomonadaceae bacterium]
MTNQAQWNALLGNYSASDQEREMTNKMVIALVDGSAYSESLCHYAAWVARRSESKVKVYHVMGRRDAPEKLDLSGTIRLGAQTKLLEQLSKLDAERSELTKEHGRAILEDAKKIIQSDSDIEVETRLRHGDLLEMIASKEDSGDMILIGKRGEAADFAKDHLGSNLERILRATHKPVFIANRNFKPIEKLLVAYDGGPSSQKAIDYIANGPLFTGLPVTLVFAGKDSVSIRESLNQAAATLKDGGLEPEIIIRSGEPEQVLAQVKTESDYDLLVMGAYGHSRIRTLIIGSTTTTMIRSCRLPILVIK